MSYNDGTSWISLGSVDGEDGKTPQFKVDGAILYVSYNDGRTWNELAEIGCAHEYDSEVTKKATALADGTMLYTCTKCNDSYTEAIPATKSIKILAIGNSFSIDAMEHLYGLLVDAGVEEIKLGNLYIGGCSLDTHWSNMQNDSAAYDLYLSNALGVMTNGTAKRSISYAFSLEEWDIVTIQQASSQSTNATYFSNLQNVINYVKTNEAQADLWWHMTWAYASDYQYLSGTQMQMYNNIVSVVNSKILTNSDIVGVIPSGTTIQNLRTSTLGDTLNRDGSHLSYGTGRYAAAMTWLAALTGADVDSITWTPTSYSDTATNLALVKEAVKNAMTTPFAVTQSTTQPESGDNGGGDTDEVPDDVVISTTTSPLTSEDEQYLQSIGKTPANYKVLDLTLNANQFYNSIGGSSLTNGAGTGNDGRFVSTQIFNKYELPTGSIIVIASGYQYRPEGWADLSSTNTATTRPGNVTTAYVEVNATWWGAYNYRAFNIATNSLGQITEAQAAAAFKIYVPVEQ